MPNEEMVPDGVLNENLTGKRRRIKVNKQAAKRVQDPARRRVLFLCEQTGEAGPVRIIRTFANRYRMRKWVAVAVDIDPTLKERLKVIHGRWLDLKELLGAE